MHQRDAPRQFGFARVEIAQLGIAGLAVDFQHRGVLAALAIEQRDGFAGPQAQHAQRVMGQGVRQGDAGAGGQGYVAVEAGGGHGCCGSRKKAAAGSGRPVERVAYHCPGFHTETHVYIGHPADGLGEIP
ncbi:hypothetical protein D3C72_1951350 [compost metagenome]